VPSLSVCAVLTAQLVKELNQTNRLINYLHDIEKTRREQNEEKNKVKGVKRVIIIVFVG
jgi:hypothetical protein